jgi:hypothetical protein
MFFHRHVFAAAAALEENIKVANANSEWLQIYAQP